MTQIKILVTNPLTSENYPLWRSQVEKIFCANGFMGFLDGSIKSPDPSSPTHQTNRESHYQMWSLLDQNIASALLSVISVSILPYVLSLKHCAEIWSTLSHRLQASTRSRTVQLKNEVYHLTKGEQTMTQYLLTVKSKVDAIAATGCSLDPEEIIFHTLNGLPAKYQTELILSESGRARPTPSSPTSVFLIRKLSKADELLFEAFKAVASPSPARRCCSQIPTEPNPRLPLVLHGQGRKTPDLPLLFCPDSRPAALSLPLWFSVRRKQEEPKLLPRVTWLRRSQSDLQALKPPVPRALPCLQASRRQAPFLSRIRMPRTEPDIGLARPLLCNPKLLLLPWSRQNIWWVISWWSLQIQIIADPIEISWNCCFYVNRLLIIWMDTMVVIDGLLRAAGLSVLRRPGSSSLVAQRHEPDSVIVLFAFEPHEQNPFGDPQQPITLDDLYTLLCSEELNLAYEASQELQSLTLSDNTLALTASRGKARGRNTYARGRSSNSQRTNRSTNPSNRADRQLYRNTICQICSKQGHSAVKCWYRHDTNYQEPPQSQALFSPTDGPAQTDWFLDTGASTHLTSNPSHLRTTEPYTGQSQVTLGNGHQLLIQYTGKGLLPTPTSNLKLHNLYQVPDMSFNLLSVSQLTQDNSCTVTFSSHGYQIKDLKTKRVLLQGPCHNGLYSVHSSAPSSSLALLSVQTIPDL
ncbi:hypothetical protein KFK09_016689 [Dendrobium nobile]|uniref:Retrovirus-related Pol polyprotein from transposon TNT 1-94-like beta-barrel domain-containing protein n=1 Tax=Dendrobium nobile TaxID=94219 RepID=A0A8T3B0B2_DENNO|nr:hypothetical protein KFK09_016689 [Dendrobium nobile]